jgi:hypothetical protein
MQTNHQPYILARRFRLVGIERLSLTAPA